MAFEIERSGACIVGATITLRACECPEGWIATWSVEYGAGNIALQSTTGVEIEAVITGTDPWSVSVECCEP